MQDMEFSRHDQGRVCSCGYGFEATAVEVVVIRLRGDHRTRDTELHNEWRRQRWGGRVQDVFRYSWMQRTYAHTAARRPLHVARAPACNAPRSLCAPIKPICG